MLKRSPPSRITAAIQFHREGTYADTALQSLLACVGKAAAAGFDVQTVAILDQPDALTREIVKGYGARIGLIKEVAFGDLGRSRNFAVSVADGDAIAFFDGDDLWGEDWIVAAMRFLAAAANPAMICHPQYVYYFDERDFLNHSLNDEPAPGARGFYLVHEDSDWPNVDLRKFYFCNLYTSNVLALRSVFEQFPYLAIDHEKGLGVEDWAWNFLTLSRGVRHAAVPDTVHLVRVRESGSLSFLNTQQGLMPPLFMAGAERHS
jgi:glycosyltransferase involved in cell wall biosynthesis